MPSIVDALKELGFDVDDAKAELLKAKLEDADEVALARALEGRQEM